MTNELKQKLEKIAEERANEIYKPLHPAWSGTENQAFLSGFESATDLLLPLLTEAIEAHKVISCGEVFVSEDRWQDEYLLCVKQSVEALNSINEKLEGME